MDHAQFEKTFPVISGWIQQTLLEHATRARSIASLGFNRLPLYFNQNLLQAAKVVYISPVPVPPLSAIGLSQFSEFEEMDPAGITYMDTFFSREEMRDHEAHHFHELIHVVQWNALGSKGFLAWYADGLERIGYRGSPLETMAYTLENVFRTSEAPFDVAKVVREQLDALYGDDFRPEM